MPRQRKSSTKVPATVILGPNDFVTGVRGMDGGGVVLTGTAGGQAPLLYVGPLPSTTDGQTCTLTPEIAGHTVTSATFYGPDTPRYTPSIAAGNVRAVGSCVLAQGAAHDHGLFYEGPPAGGGRWSILDVPSDAVGGKTVWNTLCHSTMGDLVVGNYDIARAQFSANAFVFDLRTRAWTVFDLGGALTTAYGIWQTQRGGADYVICGGIQDGRGINKAYLVRYNSQSGAFSGLTTYSALNVASLVTHFEGITARPGGFNLAALTARDAALFCTVEVNADGSFGRARWLPYEYPGSMITTGNTIYETVMMGIFVTPGSATTGSGSATVQSYAASFG
ncbi:MAG: hypothetical protein ACREHE_04465 [Rhizomicrobium sp.]